MIQRIASIRLRPLVIVKYLPWSRGWDGGWSRLEIRLSQWWIWTRSRTDGTEWKNGPGEQLSPWEGRTGSLEEGFQLWSRSDLLRKSNSRLLVGHRSLVTRRGRGKRIENYSDRVSGLSDLGLTTSKECPPKPAHPLGARLGRPHGGNPHHQSSLCPGSMYGEPCRTSRR